MRILVVAAHPDDEALGCGGTMARLASEGHDVHVAIAGAGRDPVQTAGAARASAALGVHLPVLGRGLFDDNEADGRPLLGLVRWVEERIAEVEAEVVYTHHEGDLNVDHHAVARAVLVATRPGLSTVKEVLAFFVPSSTEWAFGGGGYDPNVFVDVSGTMDAKLAALECYAGEMREFPHPRSREAVLAHAAVWGSVSGVRAAEAFRLVRRVP